MDNRNDTVPPVVGRKFRRRDGEIVTIMLDEDGDLYSSADSRGQEWSYAKEHGYFGLGYADLIEMLSEEDHNPTSKSSSDLATVTLRVSLDQLSSVCMTPGVEVVAIQYPEETE